MPTTTTASLLRLEHAELCTECHDLLPQGTPVAAERGAARCLACADPASALRLVRTDAWSVLDDPDLRARLQLRRHSTGRPFALSA